MAGQRPPDAYICYGVQDAGWVRVLAGRLFQADLEVFLDAWEPDDHDMLALRLAQGSALSRCAVLVVGPGTPIWAAAGYEALAARSAGGQPRCVLVRHNQAPQGRTPPDEAATAVPDARLFTGGVVDFRNPADFEDALTDLIRVIGPSPDPSRTTKAGIAHPRAALLSIGAHRVTCTITGGDGPVVESTAELTVDGHGFNALMWSRQRHDPEALLAIGTALGATYTPDPVGRSLEDAADEAYGQGTTLTVGIVTGPEPDGDADGDLGDLPWETLILPGHSEPLALHPATRVYRAYAEDTAAASTATGDPVAIASTTATVPGPLRILVVIANPDSGSLVDYERELAAIMDAVQPARRHHGAYVRILNEGTLPAIHEALAQELFHVLHISCHARPGALLLEDGYGRAREVTPEALCAAMPPGRGVPLVLLSGCWTAPTAPGTEELSALAWSLLPAGVPQVLAMTAPVTDRYATALCASLYRELALSPQPDVLAALAHARRAAEAQRRAEAATSGRPAPAEWATPALYLRGLPAPLYDPRVLDVGPDRPRTRVEFVGRGGDLRRLVTAMRQTGSQGVLLHGIGGAGKSVLAARAVRMLGAEAGEVVSSTGPVTVDDLLPRIDRIPAGRPAVLLLDDFEANLVRSDGGDSHGTGPRGGAGRGTWTVSDPQLAQVLSGWAAGAGPGRLVLTSRHPFELPGGSHRRLWNHRVGPLSWPEARKFIWHLRALDTLSLADQYKSYVDVGGHPRSLEILDALLRRPGANFTEVRQRMERLLRDRRIDRPELWMAQVGKRGVDASLAEAVTLAVHPSLLADLLAGIPDGIAEPDQH